MKLTLINRLKLCWEILTIRSGHAHAAHEKCLSTFVRGYEAGRKDEILNISARSPTMTDELRSVAAIVRGRRGGAGLRAAAKEIGISPTTLSKVERGHLPDMKTLQAISKWIKCAPESLLADLYAIPPTHRVVSAGTLARTIEIVSNAGFPNWAEYLQAIIDNQPTG